VEQPARGRISTFPLKLCQIEEHLGLLSSWPFAGNRYQPCQPASRFYSDLTQRRAVVGFSAGNPAIRQGARKQPATLPNAAMVDLSTNLLSAA